MKILDKESNTTFNDLYLFLTRKEATELSNEFQKILKNPKKNFINLKGEDVNGELTKLISIRIENVE